MENKNSNHKLPLCPNCKRHSIIGIHASSTSGRRVLLHNYQCSCGYDTGNWLSDEEAKTQLETDQKNSK